MGVKGGTRGIRGGIPGVDLSTSQAGQGYIRVQQGGGQGVCRGWPPTQEGATPPKPEVIEGVTVGPNSPRDDHVSNN